jgi:hypothetical protein
LNIFRKLEKRTKANRPNPLTAHPHSVSGLPTQCVYVAHGLAGQLLGSPMHRRTLGEAQRGQEHSRGRAVLAGGDFMLASGVTVLRLSVVTPEA